jgi:hypothetical protein
MVKVIHTIIKFLLTIDRSIIPNGFAMPPRVVVEFTNGGRVN